MSIARLMQQAAAGVPTGDVWTDPDLANASYDSVSFSVAGQETSSFDCFFKPDGTKMYITGTISDSVHEYNLSSAWDVSTASFVQSFSVSSQASAPSGLFFKPDGTKMYITGTSSDSVHEYNLSSAWDVSTASFVQSFSVSLQEKAPTGVVFKPDGSKMYIIGSVGDEVNEYDLSTAWDVSTASYVQTFSVASQETNPRSLAFNPDGTKLFVIGSVTDAIYEYALSAAWDISTASYSGVSFSVSSQETNPQGLSFKSDGSKMYVLGLTNNTIYQYSTVTPAAPSWTDPDLANASYDSVSFSVATEDGTPRGLFIGDNGTSLYFCGDVGNEINQYSLSTAWDISTASYVQNFSVASQETNPSSIYFRPDGEMMYITGFNGDEVNQYSLSTAWDISSASYVQNFSVATQETVPNGIFFKHDGTVMYVSGSAGDAINQYSLSTAWDISTASYVQNFSVAISGPIDLFLGPDGDVLFLNDSSTDSVYKYLLSTPWDISTASSSGSFSVASQDASPTGLFFKSDGSKMYIVGAGTDTIYQYST